ncbi:hypothetical protein MMC17_000616 [Xylographa soralifera]|nr:hypothetical protein [Xylographa soralifera]
MAGMVPTPPGLPFVGNSFDVDSVDQTASLMRLADIHGPIFEVRLMQGSYVVCADYELYNELCDEKRFTKDPAGGLSELRHGLGDGLFTAKFGEHNWDVAHRVLVPAFGPLAISEMFDEMHGLATQMVLKWARFGSDRPVSCTDDFTKLTLDTIALCSMGTRFNSFYRDEVHPFPKAMTAVLLESGHETTSGFLAFLFYRFMVNPKTLQTAQKEVDDVIGTGSIRVQHMSKLPYLNACLREAIRLNPPAAASYMKTHPNNTDDPVILCGGKYQVPRGTTFRNLVGLVHQDRNNYGSDADVFRPERMLDENFSKLPRNAWKPFGNGSRSCIGVDFAWQESLLAVAMILQNFNVRMADPDYKLRIQQTLTVKPEGLFMYATLRDGLSVGVLEKRLRDDSTLSGKTGDAPEISGVMSDEPKKPMSVFFGGNMGTCESLARTIVNSAANHGYKADVQPLDNAMDSLPTDRPVIIITSSYEGQPPDNARGFFEWAQNLDKTSIVGVSYAVFGCGNRHWKNTFQHVPKTIDECLEKAGAKRLVGRGISDAANNHIFDDFEKWECDMFWPPVKAAFGGEDTPTNDTRTLDVEISAPCEPSHLNKDVGESIVLKNEIISSGADSSKRHIELQLPPSIEYRAGDYLGVHPINPPETMQRVAKQFDLSLDAVICIKSKDTFFPQGVPMPIRDMLGPYVELGQAATRSGVKTLIHHTDDSATKAQLESLIGDSFATTISAKNTSILDLLEAYPSIALPFPAYLAMLTSLHPRQYSISSSPLANPGTCSLTFSVLAAPALSDQSRTFLGVASTYLSSLSPGDRLTATHQPSAPSFHLPTEAAGTPLIMICAGTGIAPFRGFIQERATLSASGKPLAPALLFMGCRDPHADALYDKELAQWTTAGAVAVRWAFSRGGSNGAQKKHVQERLWDERREVKTLFDQGAKLFVCGKRAMADGVAEVVRRMRREWADESALQAGEWFERVKGERFVSDVFD